MTPVRRLKHLADVRFSSVDKKTVDGQVPVKLCNYTDVYYSERIHDEMPFMDASATPDQVAAFTLRAGDVLLTKDSETADDIGVSSFVPQNLPGVLCGYHLAIARPDPSVMDGRYLRWALVATPSRKQLELAATGVTRFGLRQDAVEGMTLSVPPLMKQHAIADYLDAEVNRLDQVVGRRQQQLRALEYRRSSLVVQWITGRGVQTESEPAPSTPSGTGFPAAWKRIRLRFLVGPVQAGDWGSEPTGHQDISVVRAADFNRRRWKVDPSRLPIRSVDRSSIAQRELRPGDLVLEKSGGGPEQPVGAVVLYDLQQRAVPSNFAARLRPSGGVDPGFLCYVFAAAYAMGLNQSSIKQTTGIQNLDVGSYLSEEWWVPAHREQVTIRKAIDSDQKRIDELVATMTEQIAALQERRLALITAAVTGQLEIPGVST